MEILSTAIMTLFYLGALWPTHKAIIIVHYFQESVPSTSTSVHSVTVNISREVISNEVDHSLHSVTDDIRSIKEKYEELSTKLNEVESERNWKYEKLLDEISKRDEYVEVVTDKVIELERTVKAFRMGLVTIYRELIKSQAKASQKGIPEWYRKVRHRRLQMKLKQFQKGLDGALKRDNLQYDHYLVDKRDFCQKYREQGMRGVPPWVQDIKRDKYRRECQEKVDSKESHPQGHVYYKQHQHGYEEDSEDEETLLDTKDDETQSSESNASRKSQKRKIDEVFLKLMMRSQRMSWTDLNLMKENIALFVEHVTETAKLCSGVVTPPYRKHFEACKERIGMNFAMSLAVALTTTVTFVASVFISALVVFKLKDSVLVLIKKLKTQKFSPSRMFTTLNVAKTPRHIQALMHQVISPDLCVLVYGEEALDQSRRLVERLVSSTGLKLTPLFHSLTTLPGFHLLPKARAYLVMVDVSKTEGRFMFEDTAGQNNVLFKVSEELNSQAAQTFLVCTQDPQSKQLPRGSLYNKALVARNDNYLLRAYCRGQRCVSCNQEFTHTQATHLHHWLQEATVKK